MAAEEDYELGSEDDEDNIEELEKALAMSMEISNDNEEKSMEIPKSNEENETNNEDMKPGGMKRKPEGKIKPNKKSKVSGKIVLFQQTKENIEINIKALNEIKRDKEQLGSIDGIEEANLLEELCAAEEEHRMNMNQNFEKLLIIDPEYAEVLVNKHEVLMKSTIKHTNSPEASLSLPALQTMISASSEEVVPTQIPRELLMNEIPMTLSACSPPLGRRHIAPDGDCLFQSILYELRRVNPEETRTSAELRKDVWQKILHLKENGNDEQKQIIEAQIDVYGIENFEKVVTTPSLWAHDLGDTLPWIIATLLNMDVHIYDQSMYLDRQRSFVQGGDRPILRLIYSGSHYDATTPSKFPNSGGGMHGRRFIVGQRVIARIGSFNDWQKGTISSVNDFGMYVYSIDLDDGHEVDAPRDSDECICALIDEDHPNLHPKPPIHELSGKTLEGRWYCGKLGLGTFEGVQLLLDKEFSPPPKRLELMGRMYLSQHIDVKEADYIIASQSYFKVKVGNVSALGVISDDGNSISFIQKIETLGERWRRLEEKDELIYNEKSLDGVWEWDLDFIGKRVQIKGNKCFPNEHYVKERLGDNPDPNSLFNWLFLKHNEITLVDMVSNVELHGKISCDGNTISLGALGKIRRMPEGTDVNGYLDSGLPSLIELNFSPGHYIATENQNGIEEGDLVYMEKFEEGESEHRGYIGGNWIWVTMVDKDRIYFEKAAEVETGMTAGYYTCDKLFTLVFFDNDRSLRAHILKADVVYLSNFRFVTNGDIMGKIIESNNNSNIGGWVRIFNEHDHTMMLQVEVYNSCEGSLAEFVALMPAQEQATYLLKKAKTLLDFYDLEKFSQNLSELKNIFAENWEIASKIFELIGFDMTPDENNTIHCTSLRKNFLQNIVETMTKFCEQNMSH